MTWKLLLVLWLASSAQVETIEYQLPAEEIRTAAQCAGLGISFMAESLNVSGADGTVIGFGCVLVPAEEAL